MRPLLIARSSRSGVIALNVLTGALDADPRTANLPTEFLADRERILKRALEALSAGQLVVVAWSFFSTDLDRAKADFDWIRRQLPPQGVWHVAGGPHATAEPKSTLGLGFDLVAVGEGEVTLSDVLHAVESGADPGSVRGTAHLADGELVVMGSAERRPLDDFPAFNLRFGRMNPIEITRGCIYACSFCQTPFMFKARFRHRSVENVRFHVEQMRARGARFVRFISPTALSYGAAGEQPDLGAVEALLTAAREAIGEGGKVYFGSFPSELRPEHVTRAALVLLRRLVDNETLLIGGQSGSARVLSASHRGHGTEVVESAVRLAVEVGFTPQVDFLFGLPGETRTEREQSLAFAERLAGHGARIHNHAFMPLPGTPLGNAAPEVIEAQVSARMARMESAGSLYGQWRAQQVAADTLARRRRHA